MARIDFIKATANSTVDYTGKHAIIGKQAYAKHQHNPVLDLAYGGQFGWSPNLSEWVSNQGYVRNHLVCLLLEAPKFFNKMPDADKWVESLRALFELHAEVIDGFSAGLTVEFDNHNVGGAGEIHEEPIDVKRAPSKPKFTFTEKYGRPIQTFIQNWIQYGIMDPDTKYALIGTLAKGQVPEDMLADWFTATILVFEPDPTHTKVVNAWLSTNVMPTSTGDITGKRDLASSKELVKLDLEFTAISQTGLGPMIVAQNILSKMNLENANPWMKPGFVQEIHADVNKDGLAGGYVKGIDELARTSIKD